jgi:hypothetical protein
MFHALDSQLIVYISRLSCQQTRASVGQPLRLLALNSGILHVFDHSPGAYRVSKKRDHFQQGRDGRVVSVPLQE